LASHHKEHRGYNERNWGIGVEHHFNTTWHVAAGTYRNSYYRQTVYTMVGLEAFRLGNWRFGAAGGGVTGYTAGRMDTIFFPIVAYERGNWGFNLAPLSPAVTGLQVKWKFN